MSVGCPEPEPARSLPCCGPGAAPGSGAGVPLLTEDMQALTLRTLAASDVTKHYELVRELGKGTYGKVDLVAYKGTGECLGTWVVAHLAGQGRGRGRRPTRKGDQGSRWSGQSWVGYKGGTRGGETRVSRLWWAALVTCGLPLNLGFRARGTTGS